MKWVAALLVLSGCGASLSVPAPLMYPGACPKEDFDCQRNVDAQTLTYIGEREAAVRLMCSDQNLSVYMGEACGVLPALY